MIYYIKQFFRWLFRLSKSAAASVEAVNIVQKPQETEAIKIQDAEVKETPWFSKANDLVAEFSCDPVPIHNSNFDYVDDKPVGWILPEGVVIQNKDSYEKLKVDKEELLADDVELLKDKVKPETTEEKKVVEYAVGIDPYYVEDKDKIEQVSATIYKTKND